MDPKNFHIPTGWDSKSFSQIFEKISTTNIKIKQREYLDKGIFPVIDQGENLIGGYTLEKNKMINSNIPIIIFGDHTKIIKYINFPFAPGADGVKVIRPINKNNPKYLYYLLHIARKLIPDKGYARHFQYLEKLSYPIPTPKKQNKIVEKIEELFSELDNSILNLLDAKKSLKLYKKSVLNFAIKGLLIPQNKSNIPAIETLEKITAEKKIMFQPKGRKKQKDLTPIKQSDIPFTVPNSWEWIRLGTIVKNLNQGWSPKCHNRPSSNIEKWGVIKTSSIQHMYFNYNENKELPENLSPREQHELKKGDLLITRAGPRNRVGVCCLIKNIRKHLMLCDKAYRFELDSSWIIPEFLEIILNSPLITDVIDKMKTGISDSGVNLTQGGALNILIPFPPLEEQALIAENVDHLLSSMQESLQAIDVTLNKEKYLKLSILDQAFKGLLI